METRRDTRRFEIFPSLGFQLSTCYMSFDATNFISTYYIILYFVSKYNHVFQIVKFEDAKNNLVHKLNNELLCTKIVQLFVHQNLISQMENYREKNYYSNSIINFLKCRLQKNKQLILHELRVTKRFHKILYIFIFKLNISVNQLFIYYNYSLYISFKKY